MNLDFFMSCFPFELMEMNVFMVSRKLGRWRFPDGLALDILASTIFQKQKQEKVTPNFKPKVGPLCFHREVEPALLSAELHFVDGRSVIVGRRQGVATAARG